MCFKASGVLQPHQYQGKIQLLQAESYGHTCYLCVHKDYKTHCHAKNSNIPTIKCRDLHEGNQSPSDQTLAFYCTTLDRLVLNKIQNLHFQHSDRCNMGHRSSQKEGKCQNANGEVKKRICIQLQTYYLLRINPYLIRKSWKAK